MPHAVYRFFYWQHHDAVYHVHARLVLFHFRERFACGFCLLAPLFAELIVMARSDDPSFTFA